MRGARLRPRILWLVERWPRQSFVVAAALDLLTRALGRSRHSRYFRRRVLVAATWRPSKRWPFPCRVAGADPAALRPPMILVSFHTGGVAALRLLLTRLPGRILILQHEHRVSPPVAGIERISTGGGELARIAAAKHAGDVLRGGGFVFMMLDPGGSAATPIAVFDRTFFVSSGAFRLARITRTPILPVIAERHGRRMEIVLGAPIAPTGEAAMAAELAAWLEAVFPEGARRSRLITRLSG
jgi:hypothetical protein